MSEIRGQEISMRFPKNMAQNKRYKRDGQAAYSGNMVHYIGGLAGINCPGKKNIGGKAQ